MGWSKSSAKREVHTNTNLTQGPRKNQINNLTLKATRKRRRTTTTKPKVSGRKEIKDQSKNKWNIWNICEINERVTKINKAKA